MSRSIAFLIIISGLAWGVSPLLPAQSDQTVDFERYIRPILSENCFSCHGPDENSRQVELRLDTREGLFSRRDNGTPVISNDLQASLLYKRIASDDPEWRMPHEKEPLSKIQISLIRRWIQEGASWNQHWSFRSLTKPQLPSVKDEKWVRNGVDRFVLARLETTGLKPSPEADRRTLIRRLSLDLAGLPPTPDEVHAFLNDWAPDAYEKLVERLLQSPRYGERWGRHWLDVVHYGESHGYDKDKPRRNAWPYRDYVIRSFNEDKPYIRFVQEQLAGDALFPDDPQGVVATGFIAAGPWDFVGHRELREGTKDKKIARLLDRDDMLAATMSTFTSMTAHCARCHAHKFDPITQEDYYSLQAVFSGVDRAERPFDLDPQTHQQRQRFLHQERRVQAGIRPILDAADRLTSSEIEAIDEQLDLLGDQRSHLVHARTEGKTDQERASNAEIDQQIKRLEKQLDSIRERRRTSTRALLKAADQERLASLEEQLDRVKAQHAQLPEPQWVYAAASYFQTRGTFRPALNPRPVHLLKRGSVETPVKLMAPGAISAVDGPPSRFVIEDPLDEGARRAALARWITDPENPLTWRSITNRVWHYHFGKGIVDTPNDFGRMGSLPTHPDLLDWLSVEFRDSDGSLKALHRLIVTSAVYRQSSRENAKYAKIDAGNRYLWRMNRLRLDAESVRDSVLYIAGKLDLTMGGPSAEHFFFKSDHSPVYDYTHFDPDSPASYRRSIYRFLVRSVPDPFMESLDCPDPSLLTPKRNSTLTAIQALVLLNDPLIVRQAEHFAARLRITSGDLSEQIEEAYRLALGRVPSREESHLLKAYAQQHGLANLCRLIFNSNEFMFVD